MAVANTNIAGHKASVFTVLIDLLVRMMENHPHSRQIERLNAMSDEDLAAKGVTRQDVVRHIFRDRYYI
ncbi:MAG: DUF1127 domain-containing protein [Rhodovulum sp.]